VRNAVGPVGRNISRDGGRRPHDRTSSGRDVVAAMNEQALARYVGTRIKLSRRIAGLTAGQLACASSFRLKQVNDIEAGRTLASSSELAQIASALGCELSTWFDDFWRE